MLFLNGGPRGNSYPHSSYGMAIVIDQIRDGRIYVRASAPAFTSPGAMEYRHWPAKCTQVGISIE